jgi:hypothetical protein
MDLVWPSENPAASGIVVMSDPIDWPRITVAALEADVLGLTVTTYGVMTSATSFLVALPRRATRPKSTDKKRLFSDLSTAI